jgi:class 3 adenylate cyclase
LRALDQAYGGPDGYYLNFYGPPGTFPTVSAADLLAPEENPEASGLALPDLRGRVVFVGYQELDIPQASDSFPTAFPSRHGVDLSGVEIAATAFANLLHRETLVGLPEWARTVLVLALGGAFALASCLGAVWRGLAATLALAATYGAVALAGFAGWQLWLPVVVPLLGLLPLAVGLGLAIHYLGAARWLGIYVPRQVSQHLLQGDEFAAARPQRREVTVMLTDIVGFTTLAEQSSPEAVTEFVNRHFTMLTRCVEAEGGTVAQFIGDSVMAFWGAPDPQPDHAARACRAALAIAAALEAENGRRRTRGEAPIRMRVGIHTGEVTAGSVGAPGRSNYGIVGDAVNATQRIEQLAKTVCRDRPTAAILTSGRARVQAGEGFAFVEVGAHALRGRQEVMRIHRLVPGIRVVPATAPPQEPSADDGRVSAAGGG